MDDSSTGWGLIMNIRKSMLESYDFCPRQMYHQYIEGVEKQANQKMLIGTRFHEFAERFFDVASTIDHDAWYELIPEEFNDEEQDMTTWFITFQRMRWMDLERQNKLDYFTPMYRELFMICDTIKLQSTLDGAEWIDRQAGTVRLIEYKTGGKIDKDAAFRQLAFYAVLWTMSGNPGTIKQLRLINPRLQVVVDAEYTDKLRDAALKRVAKLRAAIDNDDFPYKCTDGKYAACRMCKMEEIPKLFPSDGYTRLTDIYGVDHELKGCPEFIDC